MLARILVNRRVKTDKEIDRFLNAGLEDLYDPFLLKGMEEAVSLIYEAIEEGRRIRIIGDYDADGVCSAYTLFHYLEFLKAKADVYLPDRVKDGYGMNESMACDAKKDGVDLIITCDNGISAVLAVSKAKELGMRVIVTDHHTPPEVLPDADVLIDPKQEGCSYPYKEICGCAVAYKLDCALARRFKEEKGIDSAQVLDYLLQFVGIATVTDIVPLMDENRIFAKEGIARLKITENPGLKALMEIKKINKEELSSYHISYIIGPALNSAGRLKNARIAFDLLNERDPLAAYEKAQILSDLNEERKSLTLKEEEKGLEIAREKIKTDKILVLYLPQAHESVAGIVAGRIKEELNRPAIVITDSREGLKGSGRSIEGYDIIKEISKYPELFKKFGGHSKACGFTLNCTPQKLSDVLNRDCLLSEKDLVKKVWIDMQLPFEYVTEGFIEELRKLEPFGTENERPLFAEKDITVLSSAIVGRNSNCLKMRLKNNKGTVMDAVKFGPEEKLEKDMESIRSKKTISLTYLPEIDVYRNFKNIQLKISSIR